MYIIQYVQSFLLIISAIFMIIAAIGFLSLNKDMKNVVYARLHIIGIFDMSVVLALIGLGEYLLAGIYFVLVPFTAHAIAYGYYKSEDVLNNESLEDNTHEDKTENPFIFSKKDIQEVEQKDLIVDANDNVLSLSTLEISEDD